MDPCNNIQNIITRLLNSVPRYVQNRMVIRAVEHVVFCRHCQSSVIDCIAEFVDSMKKYHDRLNGLKDVYEKYQKVIHIAGHMDDANRTFYRVSPLFSKHTQQICHLVFDLYYFCCLDDIYAAGMSSSKPLLKRQKKQFLSSILWQARNVRAMECLCEDYSLQNAVDSRKIFIEKKRSLFVNELIWQFTVVSKIIEPTIDEMREFEVFEKGAATNSINMGE